MARLLTYALTKSKHLSSKTACDTDSAENATSTISSSGISSIIFTYQASIDRERSKPSFSNINLGSFRPHKQQQPGHIHLQYRSARYGFKFLHSRPVWRLYPTLSGSLHLCPGIITQVLYQSRPTIFFHCEHRRTQRHASNTRNASFCTMYSSWLESIIALGGEHQRNASKCAQTSGPRYATSLAS